MRLSLASPVWIAAGLALAACKDEVPDSNYTSGVADTESAGESTSEESTGSGESTDTGEVEPYVGLRYVVAGSEGALMLGVNLDDPSDVPDPQVVISGEIPTGIFDKTPFGTQIVTHDDRLDQLRLTENGNYDFQPLVSQDAQWLDRIFFGAEGANAIVTISPTAFGAANQLIWVEYDAEGQVALSNDITPPLEANGAVLVLDRSPDDKTAAVLVDAELDSLWHLYALDLDPSPNIATYIDVIDLAGLPPTGVSDFLWLHLDDTRMVYRKEGQPGVFRPLAVDLAVEPIDRINLTPSLGHISSLVWSPDASRLLVTTGGEPGYRELYLIEMTGPTEALEPLRISEVGLDAQVATQVEIDVATIGHGFDQSNRIWYAYGDGTQTLGLDLVTVTDGVIDRRPLRANVPGHTVSEVYYDVEHQLLGWREQSASLSGIEYVDLSQPDPFVLRVAQDFTNFGEEVDNAQFAWSADASRLAIVGVQDGLTSLHVSDLADTSGTTTEITLPEVEASPGITLHHAPQISDDGQHVILWYEAQDGRDGLVYAPTDGSIEGQSVLGLDQELREGAFLQYPLP